MSSCLVMENQFSGIPPGMWRAELDLTPRGTGMETEPMRQSDRDRILPFLFQVTYANADSFYIEIINGEERILVNDVIFGHNRATGRDSVILSFPEYNSYIIAYYEEDILEGRWYVPGRGEYSLPFLARHGQGDRFDHVEKAIPVEVTGKWRTTFGIDAEHESYPAIGQFKQSGTRVSGTFLTETGDFRYLDGKVIGEHLWLSTFDGSHAFLFKGKILSDSSMTGFFKSGNHYETLWSAVRQSSYSLPDPDSLTFVKDDVFDFEIALSNGDVVNLESEFWNGKAKIIQIMGTWCPNCKDESLFLSSFEDEKPDDLEILAVAFERGRSRESMDQSLKAYREKLDISYRMIAGGPANKGHASEVFASLNGITSFPTLIFLNKTNQVVRIHTGFNGPATAEYESFKTSFYQTINEITDQ